MRTQDAGETPAVLPWLDPSEQTRIVALLLEHGLIRFSNARDLPLKSGGKTDVYINLRDARNHPRALEAIALAFENPLRRLRPDRFIEVPDAVSCFAGPLSVATGIPYLTIRERPKEGRVAKASSIGSAPFGATADLFDDVITDGASKVAPYHEARKMGLRVRNLVVLVDRQQGWRENFKKLGIALRVWPGMTLHDVRKTLISDFGVMQRCDAEHEKRNVVIVALDGKEWEETLAIADTLRTSGAILKVNDLLLARGADTVLPALNVYGRVMADFKGYDIPQTVRNACNRLRPYEPWAVTVHASGGVEMVKAAREALAGTKTLVLVVTVLTSFNEQTCDEVYHRLPLNQAKVLAGQVEAYADGFVCSPEEARVLKARHPNKLTVTPGIRSSTAPKDDQARIATPKGARDAGSDFLVMGRQILNAPDPAAELKRVHTQELGIR